MRGIDGVVRDIGELLLPRHCCGCERPGQTLCARCRESLRRPPHPVTRPSDIGFPVFALGPYSRLRRNLIIGMKEKNNRPVRPLLGAVVAAGIRYLQARGELPGRVHLVPAPTRPRSARLRGGDPVAHICTAAAEALADGTQTLPLLRLDGAVADQSSLSASDRWANMASAVELLPTAAPCSRRPLVVVDDVVTTGATLTAAGQRLKAAGFRVAGALVFADA